MNRSNDTITSLLRIAVLGYILLPLAYALSSGVLGIPPSAGEAGTLGMGHRFFTVTFLLSLYESEMPLYYLFSHFVLFLPGGLVILRVLTAIMWLGCLLTVYLVFRKITRDYAEASVFYSLIGTAIVNSALFFFPLMYIPWKAERYIPAALLCALSILHFVRLAGGERRSRPLFIAFTALAFYTAGGAFLLLIIEALSLLVFKPSGPAIRKNARSSIMAAFLAMLPGFGLIALGAVKNSAAAIPLCGPSGHALFRASEIINPAVAVILLALIALASKRISPPGAKSFIRTFVSLTAIATICVLTSSILKDYTSRSIEDDFAWRKTVSFVQENAGPNDGLVFVRACDRKDDYLAKYYFDRTGLDYVLCPEKTRLDRRLYLKGEFGAIKSAGKGFFELKELFLNGGDVWMFINAEDEGRQFALLEWLDFVAEVKTEKSYERDRLLLRRYSLKRGFNTDGILLDIFANDFDDGEKAALLASKKDFTPAAFRSFFWKQELEPVKDSINKTVSGCGEDASCRTAILSRLVLFAASDVNNPAGNLCMGVIMNNYPYFDITPYIGLPGRRGGS